MIDSNKIDLAIVISVDKYVNLPELAACARDAIAINKIIDSENRFLDKLILSGSHKSKIIKEKLSEFVKKYHNSEIGEVFVYLSGHGSSTEDEFLFHLSDSSKSAISSTTLSHRELDEMIRSLNPCHYVKIVDACQSGIGYIKSHIEKIILPSPKIGFNNVTFMFSSQSDQSSYIGGRLSDFTNAIVERIKSLKGGSVRYSDIEDGVRDFFTNSNKQHPYFVNQSSRTEIFCKSTENLCDELAAVQGKDEFDNSKSNGKTLVEIIREDAELYCTKEEVFSKLNDFTELMSKFKIRGDAQELFSVSIKGITHDQIPEKQFIGNWLDSNQDTPPVFAHPLVVNKKIDEKPGDFLARALVTNFMEWSRPTYEEIVDFKSDVKMEIECFVIEVSPNQPNLDKYKAYYVMLVSKVSIRVFWCFSCVTSAGWDDAEIEEINGSWLTGSFIVKSETEMTDFAGMLDSSFNLYIDNDINSKWGEFDIEIVDDAISDNEKPDELEIVDENTED